MIVALCLIPVITDCIPDCVNGTCDMTVGECVCDDGYIGSDCSIGIIWNITNDLSMYACTVFIF